MGISHFSGLFVLLCVGVGGALLTLAGEHGFYQLVLPHIRRRQNLKYWLHTSQKIHRALNLTYDDVKRQRAEREKSCNLEKTQAGPSGPSGPSAPAASARWNNESRKETPAAADARDFKRVHFSLETLNTRRLLARLAVSEPKGGGARGERAEPTPPRLYENGGPAASLAGLVPSLPSSTSVRTNAPPLPAVTPPIPVMSQPLPDATPPLPAVAPPLPAELLSLQQQIDQMREKLTAALARRAEIQTSLAKPVSMATTSPPPVSVTSPGILPPTLPAIARATSLSPHRKSVTTMTAPPHRVLSKVPPLRSRLSNQRR